MVKEKQGKPSAVPLPVTKVADKKKIKQKEKEQEKAKMGKMDAPKEKSKPALRSATTLQRMGPTTRSTPSKATPTTSPEGTPLLTNPRINPTTGVLYTSKAEKRAIKEILDKRHKRSLKDEEEEEEAMAFQHGPGYYTTDAQGRTYDKYRRRVFRDD